MKVAIPVKTNKEDPVVSPLFGKAKWFAFVEEREVCIEKNEAAGGIRVVDWLLEKGIDAVIVQHMGDSPYRYIQEASEIPVFYAGEERQSVRELMQKFENEELVIIDDTNAHELIRNH